MSFDAGSVTVRCPLCGTEVRVTVQVEWVSHELSQAATFAARKQAVVVASVRQRNTADHECERQGV